MAELDEAGRGSSLSLLAGNGNNFTLTMEHVRDDEQIDTEYSMASLELLNRLSTPMWVIKVGVYMDEHRCVVGVQPCHRRQTLAFAAPLCITGCRVTV